MSKVVVAGSTDQGPSASHPDLLVDSSGRVATSPPTGSSATQVQGTTQDGQPVGVINPVIVGGVDSSGNAQNVNLDSSGNMVVVGNVASGATDSGNPVKIGAVYSSTLPTLTNGQRVNLQTGTRGSLNVTLFGPDNTNAVIAGAPANALGENVGVYTIGQNHVYNGATWDRHVKSNSRFRLLGSAATTNSTNVKGSAGNVFKIIVNVAVAGKFLKLYNKATAPTVGTDTPIATIPLPTTGLVQIDFGANGDYYSAGIGFGITGAIEDADTTAVAANDLTGLTIFYS